MKTTQIEIFANDAGNIILVQGEDCENVVEVTTDMIDLVIKGLMEVRAELTLNSK